MLGQFEQAIRTESPDAGINDIALAVRHRRDDFQTRQRGHHVSGYGSDGGALSDEEVGDARRQFRNVWRRGPSA
jgi:hypothetical protein